MKLIHPGIREEDENVLISCISRLSNFSLAASEDHHGVKVFCPPISRYVTCNAVLVPHNRPVKVDFFGIRGPSEGIKVSLKCNHCGFFYGYSKYGNPQAGWSLYETPRVAIEASDVCFVELSLLRWQISLSCHCWVSFSGFSVTFNEVHDIVGGLSEKSVANAFWNGELEAELRLREES
ncbi:hypothetical protein OS493_022086 [Desmophyllum pertusum]|uniref:CxC5 like cysteine cluster associated with KDZ domain-containing protein n=1 Tax=Desmophyllum pertusum TaxID=174260 RepID=A0A9W9YML7_9CNID|nr:hypothetical protein OS493_022086 [Desmophyllum pertusum]